jgi:hypothetical protein
MLKLTNAIKDNSSHLSSSEGKSSNQGALPLLDSTYFCENRPDLKAKALLWGEGDEENILIQRKLNKDQFKALMRIELRKYVL